MAETPQTTPGEFSVPANLKLSPAQQEQVRSPEFIEWFGDWQNDLNGPNTSKMIDPDSGEPKVFYHGTNREFSISRARDTSIKALTNHGLEHDNAGTYLTDSLEVAKQFADPIGHNYGNMIFKYANRGMRYYDEIFGHRNAIVTSCRNNDGRVTIKEGDKTFNPAEFNDRLQSGEVSYTSAVQFDGESIGWAGEVLFEMGGSFPAPDDELVPYRSLYPKVQEELDKLAAASVTPLLVPARAKPRIISTFVNSTCPLDMLPEDNFRGIDNAFAEGFEQIADQPASKGYDSVVVDGTENYGINVAVPSADQMREAKV